VAKQQKRRLIGPVEVLQHENDRGVPRGVGERLGDRVEQHVPGRLIVIR
jgi:hypothetical protein